MRELSEAISMAGARRSNNLWSRWHELIRLTDVKDIDVVANEAAELCAAMNQNPNDLARDVYAFQEAAELRKKIDVAGREVAALDSEQISVAKAIDKLNAKPIDNGELEKLYQNYRSLISRIEIAQAASYAAQDRLKLLRTDYPRAFNANWRPIE